jgi:cation transport ATPase
VPAILLLALATGTVWRVLGADTETAFIRAVTVMVISCPCALGIAIPLARVAGISGAGRQGILVRDFEAFERAASIDTVVMDKTGTLTHGRWALMEVKPMGGRAPGEVLALAAGLENGVDHAVARTLISAAQDMEIAPAGVTQCRVEENGVCGIHRGDELRIGARSFALPGGPPEDPALSQPDGISRIYLSMNGTAGAVFEFGDALRPGVAGLIEELQKRGIDLHLVSGDGQGTTQTVARQVGIPNARGGLLPAEKADYVARLQARGEKVAMMGDGINDAPALAVADLSVAVHRHAALTRQAAAATLMRSDPVQLLDFLTLADRVNAKVAQNMGCAWVYNTLSIPIAMSGWLNPLVAATAMLLSSLTVIGNTLLLVRGRK